MSVATMSVNLKRIHDSVRKDYENLTNVSKLPTLMHCHSRLIWALQGWPLPTVYRLNVPCEGMYQLVKTATFTFWEKLLQQRMFTLEHCL